VLCSLRSDPREGPDSLLARLPRGGRVVDVTAQSLLHMFSGSPGGLDYLAVLPPEQVAPLRCPLAEDQGEQRPADGGPPDRGMAELSEADRALLAALGVDGRMSHADLAAATGWSESTVRRRMEQLTGSGEVFFHLELNLPVFGFNAEAWLWISVPPSELAAAGKALAGFPEVAYAAATTGPASGPRPASSQPATGQMPRLISARSRRKLGGATAITPFGSLAWSLADLSRIMPGIVRKQDRQRNREPEAIPVILHSSPLHCERSEAIQNLSTETFRIASLRSQ